MYIVAHRAFSDLVSIAQSSASLGDRRARAARRAQQFIADIRKSRYQEAVKGRFIEKLKAELETAVVHSPALEEEPRTVLREALNALRVGRRQIVLQGKNPLGKTGLRRHL